MNSDNQRGADGREIALEARQNQEQRLFSPSAARNKDAIRDVFVRTMPKSGAVLEVGSGTGEHGLAIASVCPDLVWYAGDPDPTSRLSIAAWIDHSGLTNMAAPHDFDVSLGVWSGTPTKFSGLMSANMIHIAPFSAAQGLFSCAGKSLASGSRLFLYGPFSRNAEHTASSNADFDASLKSRNPEWGVRDLDLDIIPLGTENGLKLREVISMPANNMAVLFERV